MAQKLAPAEKIAQIYLPLFASLGAVPERDALQELLLQDVHQVSLDRGCFLKSKVISHQHLININQGDNAWFVRQSHHLDHLLEAGVPCGQKFE